MKKRNKKNKRSLFNNTYLIDLRKKNNNLLDKDKEKIEISLLDDFVEEKEVNGNLKEEVFKDFESEIKEEELVEDKEFLDNLKMEEDNSARQLTNQTILRREKENDNNSEHFTAKQNEVYIQRSQNFKKELIKSNDNLQEITAENNQSKPNDNNILNKGFNFLKGIFKKEDELLDQSINILKDEIIENKKIINKLLTTTKKELVRQFNNVKIVKQQLEQNKGIDKRIKRPERIAFHTTKDIKELLNKLAELESKSQKKKSYLVDIFEKALLEYKEKHYPNLELDKKNKK